MPYLDNITHDILWFNLNQVRGGWIAGVVLYHVGVCGLLPVNINCREIDAPGNDALIVKCDVGGNCLDWKVLDLCVERIAGYGGGKIGYEWTLIAAVGRHRGQ